MRKPTRLFVLPFLWISSLLAADSSLPAPRYRIDFDGRGGYVETAAGRFLRFTVAERHLRDGYGGKGLFFQPEVQNLLPPQVAAPGRADSSAWSIEGAEAAAYAEESGDGGQALRVDFSAGGGSLRLPALALERAVPPMTKTKSYVFSFFAKSPNAEPLEITVHLDAERKSTKEQEKAESPPVTSSATFALGEAWRRYAQIVDLPKEWEAENVRIGFVASGAGSVLLERLQLEPCRQYPQFNEAPTAWMPGGTQRENEHPSVPLGLFPLPGEGTLSCRVRIENDCPDLAIGDATWLWFGGYWKHAIEFNSQVSSLGGSRLVCRDLLSRMTPGRFHLLAMRWDEASVALLLDGETVASAKRKGPLALTEEERFDYNILLGRHNPRFRVAFGTLDDIRVYDAALSDEQCVALAGESAPAEPEETPLRLGLAARSSFVRDEESAAAVFPLPASASGAIAEWQVAGEGFPFDAARCEGGADGPKAILSFRPWRLSAGRYPYRVRIAAGGRERVFEETLTIFPARPRETYRFGEWQGDSSLEHMAWLRSIGITLLDGRRHDRVYLDRLPAFGLDGSLHLVAYTRTAHPWTSAMRDRYTRTARAAARGIAPFPWLRYCLLNSEVAGDDNVPASDLATAMLKEDLGVEEPILPPGEGWADLTKRPKLDLSAFRQTGLVPPEHPPLRYLRWLMKRGGGTMPACAWTADILREAKPGLAVLTEPARKTRYVPGTHGGRDILGEWHYPRDPARLLARWSMGVAEARREGMGFYPIIGYNYASHPAYLVEGEKKISLSLSADMASVQLWMALAQPSTFSLIWLLDTDRYHQKTRSGLHERTARVIREVADRVGPVVGPVPLRPARLAVLFSFTNFAGLGAERWWHWYGQIAHDIYSRLWADNIPFDILFEEDVREGKLRGYDALYMPAATYLLADLAAPISEWAEQGGRLLLDNKANAGLPFGTTARPALLEDKSPFVNEEALRAWTADLRRTLEPYALPLKGRVFAAVKETGGARYVFVVNNAWAESHLDVEGTVTPDEATDAESRKRMETGRQPLRDTGVAQEVVLGLREAESAAVYDLLAGTRLDPHAEADRLAFAFRLGPGAGRVFAVYPRPLKRLALEVPARLEPGAQAVLHVTLADTEGAPPPGVQGVDVRITDPNGAPFDASAVYRLEGGSAAIPLRLPQDAPAGSWTVTGVDLAAGLRASATFAVE